MSEWMCKAPSDGKRIQIGPLPTSGVEAELFYMLRGNESGELVVFVDGIVSSALVWEPTIKALTDAGFRVLFFDHLNRGFSGTAPTPAPWDAQMYIEIIESLLSKLQLDQTPFHLLGHSMGGAIAIGFAAKHPTKINRLILLAPAGFFGEPFIVKALRPITSFSKGRKMVSKITGGDQTRVVRENFFAWQSSEIAPVYQESLRNHSLMFAMRPEINEAFIGTVRHNKLLFHAHQAAQTVSKQCGPILIMLGSHDKTVPTKPTHKALKQIFGADHRENTTTQIVVVPQTRHAFFLEKPKEVHDQIVAFLGGRF